MHGITGHTVSDIGRESIMDDMLINGQFFILILENFF